MLVVSPKPGERVLVVIARYVVVRSTVVAMKAGKSDEEVTLAG